MPGARITQEKAEAAVALVADGATYTAVAAALGISRRSIERRFAPGADLRLAVERLLKDRRNAAHAAAAARARRAHLPIPTSPAKADAERAELARAREEVLARQAERAAAARPLTDEAVLAWIAAQDSTCEEDFLDKREAEQGIISSRGLRRYRGEAGGRRTPPQVRVWSIPSIAEQSGFGTGSAPDWTRDQYLVAGGTYGG